MNSSETLGFVLLSGAVYHQTTPRDRLKLSSNYVESHINKYLIFSFTRNRILSSESTKCLVLIKELRRSASSYISGENRITKHSKSHQEYGKDEMCVPINVIYL